MVSQSSTAKVIPQFADPVKFVKMFWPQFRLYDKQREILYSLRDNYETIVPAGNMLGKDFIAGLAVIWFFTSRRPCRIFTTAPQSGQLEDVLWGEIKSFLETAAHPLPIEATHLHLHQTRDDGSRVAKSECVGRVVQKGESILGRHGPWTDNNEPTTLLVSDECSGMPDEPYEKADTWTHRKLSIGNCYPCTNYFYRGVKLGDVESQIAETGREKLRTKVIKIKGEDSPNVKLGLAEVAAGKEPSHTIVVPGVLTYADYITRRENWDEQRQCIGLDAEFYEGAEVKLFPPMWLDNCERMYTNIPSDVKRTAKAIGIDPAEGGDSTCFAAVDHLGLIERTSEKTPDTSVVGGKTLAFMRKHGLRDCTRVCFDRGGGGKQHADYLRKLIENDPSLRGEFYGEFRTVAFGGAATDDHPKYGATSHGDKKDDRETRYAYKNKRAEMAGRLSLRMDPSIEETQFAFCHTETELRHQLSVIPKLYDQEGQLILPPKNRKGNSRAVTLVELCGHSPDEMDSVLLAVYGLEVSAADPIATGIV